jgi:DNA-binding MarR family transcriptional regulator
MDIIGKALDFIGGLTSKNLVIILLSVSLASGVLLFSRDDFLKYIELNNFRAQFKEWIGMAFLASTALIVSVLGVTLFKWAQSKYGESRESRHQRTKRIETLRNLTPAERRVLRRYVFLNTQTQYLDMTDGVVAGLEHKGIIYRATLMGDFRSLAYNITPLAWEVLKKDPEILITNELKTLDKREVAQLAKEMGITEEEVKALIEDALQEMGLSLSKEGEVTRR